MSGLSLHELLRGLPVEPPAADPWVEGVQHDSRQVGPGDLYVAIVGQRFDGRRFAADAAARGAVAALGPAPPPDGLDLPWAAGEDPRPLLGHLAARLWGPPHERMLLAGVTGTNGKTTTTRLIASILGAAGLPAGIGGTLGYHFAGRSFLNGAASRRTTPEASDLCRLLHAMADDGARSAVLEVSSHGLEMERAAGVRFAVAVFTNLTRDHLDFHPDFDHYFAAKRRLFTGHLAEDGKAAVALDDDWGRRLAGELRPRLGARLLTCAEGEGDVRVAAARLDLGGIAATLETPRGRLEVRSPLLGRYNLKNVLTAVTAAEALGIGRETIVQGIAAVTPVRGRLDPVDSGQPFPALVDFAHTPAALEAALRSLRELTDRRVVLVFGCGGDRDRGKRPEMGKAAGLNADRVIATSDNPRSEDPEAILDQVEAGVRESGNPDALRIADRRQAIRHAVRLAAEDADAPGWAVLVAGKGHEEGQIVGDRELPFSDHGEIAQALADLGFTREDGDG